MRVYPFGLNTSSQVPSLRTEAQVRILWRMGLIHTVTHRPLSDFVDFLWLSEGYVQPHASEQILPTGNMGLVLSLEERGHARDVLSGASTRPFVLDTSKPLSMIGACFKPGGGFPFVDVPVGELQDISVSLDTFWGWKAQTLRQQLLEARTAPARFHVLENFLLEQLSRKPERHPAVKYALSAFLNRATTLSVAAVTERTGFSARRFIEVFRHEVGLTPKVYCRISRFRAAVSVIASTPTVDWAAIASACGYFDQAHFIHEFREFSGMTPSAYIRHRTGSPNHVRQPG
jgi:AraC-like DNA-binding protein